jgi:hypothetical protein
VEKVKKEENYEGLGISKGIKDATLKGKQYLAAAPHTLLIILFLFSLYVVMQRRNVAIVMQRRNVALGAAKKQGLRCQRIGAIQIISNYLKSCVSDLAATGLRNADARGAATITRADCIEAN